MAASIHSSHAEFFAAGLRSHLRSGRAGAASPKTNMGGIRPQARCANNGLGVELKKGLVGFGADTGSRNVLRSVLHPRCAETPPRVIVTAAPQKKRHHAGPLSDHQLARR